MALETGTYISDLTATNPTSSDAKSQGDDHIRLLKSTIKATFPNVTGAVTATHTQLNTVPDLAPKASPTFTGTPLAPTATAGTSTTQIATTAFVAATAFTSVLPGQTSNSGKYVTTDGTNASWAAVQIIPTVVVCTSSTTWTCPANVTRAKVTVIGGGASGSTAVSQAGGGGGGGGTAIKWLTVTPATVYTVTVGAGGAALGAGAAAGVTGGTSSFAGTGITTVFGIGGSGSSSPYEGGAGGGGINGDLNITGDYGTGAKVNESAPAPTGGGTFMAGSSAGTGVGYGGGGGSIWNAGGSYAGASGVVIIEY